tara:strand:+ start:335 stop:778 length:444 start_codon:yes stop_codon:yes gene_type:complete
MNTYKFLLFGLLLTVGFNIKAQSTDLEQITETLLNYIEGTANGEPDQLRRAFHPDFNLYSVTKEDQLRIWNGKNYIENIKVGEKNNRKGRIISIDFENNAASAKAEIIIPNWRIFTDYFLLLKYEDSWKIIHKSYTWKEFPKAEEKN